MFNLTNRKRITWFRLREAIIEPMAKSYNYFYLKGETENGYALTWTDA